MNAATLMTAVLAVASAVMTGLLLADQTDPYTGHTAQQEALFTPVQARPASAGLLVKPRG